MLLSQFLDLRSFEHAPISDKGHALAAKARNDFLNLGADGLGVAGITGKHLNGQGPALGVAQQADDDLLLARLAIPVVAPGGQGVMVAFQVAAGDVIKEEIRAAVGMELFKEPLFEAELVFRQPGQVGIKLIFVERVQLQHVASGVTARQADGA